MSFQPCPGLVGGDDMVGNGAGEVVGAVADENEGTGEGTGEGSGEDQMAQAAAAQTIPLTMMTSRDTKKEPSRRNPASVSVKFSSEATMAITPATTSSGRTLPYARVPSVSRNRLTPLIQKMRANR